MTSSLIKDVFIIEKVAGIIRASALEEAKQKFVLLREGGLKLIEISYETDFFEEFVDWSKSQDSNIKIGAASLINIDQAKKSIKCGVDFLVSPISSSEMIEYALANNKDIIPGAFSPSEIAYILNKFPDIDLIKLFPADSTSYFQNLKKVFTEVDFLISSFNIHEIQSFLEIGAQYYVIGSYFTDNMNLTVQRVRNILNVVKQSN